MARGTFYTTEQIGPKQRLTPEGFLLCEEVAIGRTGMMIYGPDETPIAAGPDGVTKIFREEADIFRPETIASALGKAVANDHPEEDVSPENWKELSHGFMLNVRRGIGAMDDLLLADLMITTPEGIKEVQGGKREVSLGYEADYEEVSPGVGKQSNIIINHVALVEQGRCGPRCAIRDHQPKKKEQIMSTKHNKFAAFLTRAFKAKDAAEVEKIAEEAKDEFEETPAGEENDIHLHINGNGDEDPSGAGIGRTRFTDEDLEAHIEQNAAEHVEMMARLTALEAALAGNSGPSADEAEAAELEKQMQDEFPEDLKEEATKAKDSKYLGDSFQDTIALAEILVPGIKVPTYDSAAKPGQTFKKICGLRKQALDIAYVQPGTRSILDDLLGGKNFDTKQMTCDAARVLFRGAAAAKKAQNNSSRSSAADVASKGSAGPMTLAELNKRNRAKFPV